jgi:hypothetical protein
VVARDARPSREIVSAGSIARERMKRRHLALYLVVGGRCTEGTPAERQRTWNLGTWNRAGGDRLRFGIRHQDEERSSAVRAWHPTFNMRVAARRAPGQLAYSLHQAVIRELRAALAPSCDARLARWERAHLLLGDQLWHTQHSAVRPFEMSAVRVVAHAWRPTGGSSVHPGWWHHVSDFRELNVLRHAAERSA